jgi:hypothetical protein
MIPAITYSVIVTAEAARRGMHCRMPRRQTETTMPQFVLDMGSPEAARRFNDLDHFTQGYITAAFWTGSDENGAPLEASFAGLSPETEAQMIEECTSFNQIADAWLDKAYLRGDMSYDMERAGTDFWLTRNRHGAGYWDRGLGSAGDKLTEFAHSFGSCDLYHGDDGLIYSA